MNYIDLGKRIQVLRRAQKMTQTELAARVGITQAFMGNIESGNRAPSLETLMAICNALKCNPDFLLAASIQYPPKRSLEMMIMKAMDVVEELSE